MKFKENFAVLGGSSQGIGKAIAFDLARQGCSVLMLARNEKKLEENLKALPNNGNQKHHFLSIDFNDPAGLAQKLAAYLNSNQLEPDILVNNSGGPPGGPIAEASEEEFERAFRMHVLCNQKLVQLLLPFMIAKEHGRIINIISTSVKIPIRGIGVSNTTRGAVASWAKSLSNEIAHHGITVNNVLPGLTETARLKYLFERWAEERNMTFQDFYEQMIASVPAGRLAQAPEIAAVVSFLASKEASYVNGVSLRVDGGRTGSI